MTYQTIKLFVPNRHHLNLATEIYKPEGSGLFPVVFLFHGFTGYKEGKDLVDIARTLAEHGTVAIRFTASGFGDSDGSLADDYRFSHYRSDADCVYEYMKSLPYCDSRNIGVYGHSMGGKLAVLFCSEHPEVRVVCIGSAPVTFAKTGYASELAAWKARGFFEKVSGRDGRTIRIPYAYVEDVDSVKNDVLDAAMRITSAHAFVIAGDADTEVPWTETKKIYDALGCQKAFELLKGIPHKYSQAPLLVSKVTAKIVTFFSTHLKGAAL